MNKISGFVCEINEETFKVYAFKEGLFDVPITEEPELGRWVLVFDVKEGTYEFCPDPKIPYFTVYEKNGVVHANILAICPCEYALPQDIGDKFADKVWNPFLGYLNDDNDVFKAQVSGGEVAEIIVRYAPKDDLLFEVMELVIWDKDPEEAKMAYMHMTPWTAEFMCTHMKPAWEMFKDSFVSCNRMKRVRKDEQTIGICIKAAFRNPAHNPLARGSKPECALLWDQRFGLVRWIHPRDPINQVGKWFVYGLHDEREKDIERKTVNWHKPSFQVTTARSAIEAPFPKPTCVVNGDVKVTCSFAWNHSMLGGDAFFADVELGKVHVLPQTVAVITQKIDAHRHELQEMDPKKYKILKNEVIIVEGKAALFDSFYQRSWFYPKKGLFFLESVTAIFYLQGGKVIWKAADEKEDTTE